MALAVVRKTYKAIRAKVKRFFRKMHSTVVLILFIYANIFQFASFIFKNRKW